MFVPNGPTGIFGRVTNNRKKKTKNEERKTSGKSGKAEKTKDSPFAVALKM